MIGTFFEMDGFELGSLKGCPLLLIATLVLVPSGGHSAEFGFFKLTGFRGALAADYTQFERSADQASSKKSGGTDERRAEVGEELSLETESYIFHPNLLIMELAGSVRFDQKDVESGDIGRESRETQYNFSGRWSFFKYKAYPFNLYYRLAHPKKEVGFADAINVRTESYGFDIFLRRPLLSTVAVRFFVDHQQSYGENPIEIVDSSYDRAKVVVDFPITEKGRGSMNLTTSISDSASGRRILPIEETRDEANGLGFGSKFTFGELGNIDVRNSLTITNEKGSDTVEETKADFFNYFTWNFDNSLRLFNNYSFSGTYLPEDEKEDHTFSLGANKILNDQWGFATNIVLSNETAPGFELLEKKLQQGFVYSDAGTGRWDKSLNYNLLYGVNRQVTSRESLEVFDERLILAGLTGIALSSEYVVPGSVSVKSLNKQAYVENIDYRVTLVGTETRIVRLASGSIADGETVLVDYEYELDGSYELRQFDQSLGARFTLDGSYGFFGHYSVSKPKLLSGARDRAVDPVDSYEIGTDASVRLNQISNLTWKLIYGRRLSVQDANRRAQAGVGYTRQLPFYGAFANLESEYQYQDNEDSPIDLKQALYRASLSLRPSWRSLAALDLTYRRDTGGEEISSHSDAAFRYQWKRARFAFDVTVKAFIEKQGETRRSESRLDAKVVRYFW